MAAAANQYTQTVKLPGMGFLICGTANFPTTDATCELLIPAGRIMAFSLTYLLAPAATEAPLSINETVTGGNIAQDARNVTVTRPAGTTSAIPFSFIFIVQK